MRFTHPELYEGRTVSGMTREAPEEALREMRRLALLRRGMTYERLRRLLGNPSRLVTYDGSSKQTYEGFADRLVSTEDSTEQEREEWYYDMRYSQLIVTFDRALHKARRFELLRARPEAPMITEAVW